MTTEWPYQSTLEALRQKREDLENTLGETNDSIARSFQREDIGQLTALICDLIEVNCDLFQEE